MQHLSWGERLQKAYVLLVRSGITSIEYLVILPMELTRFSLDLQLIDILRIFRVTDMKS